MKPREPVWAVLPGAASHAPDEAGALYELDSVFDILGVAGVSAGAINGAVYAFGLDLHTVSGLYEELLQKDRMLDRSLLAAPRFGMCEWKVVQDQLHKLLGKKTTLGQSIIPLCVVVTDARSSRPVYFSSWATPDVNVGEVVGGSTALIPLASMRYIPSYVPVRLYYDGGFTDNFPNHVFDDRAERTVAFKLIETDRDKDNREDDIDFHEWDMGGAAASVVRSVTYAASASKTTRDDQLIIPIHLQGSGLDFSLSVQEIRDRIKNGREAVRTSLKGTKWSTLQDS